MTDASALGWWGVPLAILGGAIRVGTPFLFVSLGECITEKAGRINLGLEVCSCSRRWPASAAPTCRACGGWACWPRWPWALRQAWPAHPPAAAVEPRQGDQPQTPRAAQHAQSLGRCAHWPVGQTPREGSSLAPGKKVVRPFVLCAINPPISGGYTSPLLRIFRVHEKGSEPRTERAQVGCSRPGTATDPVKACALSVRCFLCGERDGRQRVRRASCRAIWLASAPSSRQRATLASSSRMSACSASRRPSVLHGLTSTMGFAAAPAGGR